MLFFWKDRPHFLFAAPSNELGQWSLLKSMEIMVIYRIISEGIIGSLLNGLFDPATKGMLPQLVEEDKLTRANSAVASLRTLSALLGPVIGTVLYTSLGITVLFLINGISFLLSAGSEMLIGYKHSRRKVGTGLPGIVTDLTEGIKFILDSKVIRKLCVFFLIIYALIQPIFTVVLPLLFRTRLHYSDTQYGYLQMIIILGALLGSILVGLLFGKEKKVIKSLMIGCALLIGMMLAFSVLLFPSSLSRLGKGTLFKGWYSARCLNVWFYLKQYGDALDNKCVNSIDTLDYGGFFEFVSQNTRHLMISLFPLL